MQIEQHTDTNHLEEAGYFKVSDAHLYTVLHRVENPVARVLLVGPFASERHFSYHPWVRWARYLAARRIEVLRYDHRGVGESTGRFEEMTFARWTKDAALLASWLALRTPVAPLLLHGLEVGGILAAKAFQSGVGEALLLWSPPADANKALVSSLMRWAGLEQLYESTENRRTAGEYIRQLEQGASIEVAGYRWSSTLWYESLGHRLPDAVSENNPESGWPVRVVKLGRDAAPLVKPYVGYDELRSLDSLYANNYAWIAETMALPIGSPMNQEIDTRVLIVLEGANTIARATYHKPYRERSEWQSQSTRSERAGILFLNSLSPTRAAHGDSAVYWADSVAQCGYPAFRIDMPGFGDSDGEPPPDLLSFINSGGYASLVADKAAELVERFSLPGVIIVGLCAGAVSALFAAASCSQCKGLILMDPYFHLPLKSSSRLWQTLTGRISRSGPGRFISAVNDKIKAAWVFLRGDSPPQNANLPLLNSWKTLAANGLPMLVFKATGTKCRKGEFDYLRYLLNNAGHGSQVVVKVIEGAGHTFSNTTGRTGVRQETIAWLSEHFSPTDSRQSPNDASALGLAHDSRECEKQAGCARV